MYTKTCEKWRVWGFFFFLFTLGSAGAGFLLRALCNWITHSKHGITARLVSLPLFILHLASVLHSVSVERNLFFFISGRNLKNKLYACVIIHYKCLNSISSVMVVSYAIG